ncbi:hypothetical protein BRC19_01070 [Candidatus Saccharibacteria bacterium QS_5_54_17]|nr:MAG: hypothetical protein BRC19_01070 [Candidatus Saccharibacteria bacterium QS_5_54_17]
MVPADAGVYSFRIFLSRHPEFISGSVLGPYRVNGFRNKFGMIEGARNDKREEALLSQGPSLQYIKLLP